MVTNGTPKINRVDRARHCNEVTPGLTGLEGQEAAYSAALKLVRRIDEELARGLRHYRNRAGRLLTRLDEVIRAILANDLSLPDDEPREEGL